MIDLPIDGHILAEIGARGRPSPDVCLNEIDISARDPAVAIHVADEQSGVEDSPWLVLHRARTTATQA